jgi:low temperature requirement protein LtrA
MGLCNSLTRDTIDALLLLSGVTARRCSFMNELTISEAQANMRRAYLRGAPGVLVSGIVWLIGGLVAVFVSEKYSVFALLIGGALIHPISLVVAKLLGHDGTHTGQRTGLLGG